MAGYPNRISTNRSNPYTAPGAYDQAAPEGHSRVFGTYLCTGNPVPPEPAPANAVSAREPAHADQRTFHLGGRRESRRRPPCDEQAPLGNIIGQPGRFPALQPLP